MSTTTTTPPASRLELGGREYVIERPSGLKASRALALMRALSRAMPDLTERLAEFRRDYERTNVVELDRAQARHRYPAEPLLRDGELIFDEHGQPAMLPSFVDAMTDADWQSAGGVLRIPATPSTAEVVAALFDRALEVAESHVYRLVALFTIPNGELKALRRAGDGELDRALVERADELLDDAYADDLLELAVVVGETVDHHFRRKTSDLGDRVGNALRLIGLDFRRKPTTPTPAPTDGPSASRPSSSTDSPASTADGAPTPSSTPPMTSSSSSELSSTETASAQSSNGSAPAMEAPAA